MHERESFSAHDRLEDHIVIQVNHITGRVFLLLAFGGLLSACLSDSSLNGGTERVIPATAPATPTVAEEAPAESQATETLQPLEPTATQSLRPTATATAPSTTLAATVERPPSQIGRSENPVVEIPLAGPAAERRAQLSGLAWYGDDLIILPQFPDFSVDEGDGFIYTLPKAEIVAFLDGNRDQPLEPRPVAFVAPGLGEDIPGFEGYESIAFSGDTAYVTIEAKSGGEMLGYLARGVMAPGLDALTLDTSKLATIASQTGAPNIAEESLFVTDELVGVIHELNGLKDNPAPVIHLFGLDLAPAGTTALPHVPFRITDVSALNDDGRFWAINYFYPGSGQLLDALGAGEGTGNGDQSWPAWEGLGRLVEFQYSPAGITPAGTPPIQLESLLSDIHNWEGLARLDERGFLMVSDQIPATALGFVPSPAAD